MFESSLVPISSYYQGSTVHPHLYVNSSPITVILYNFVFLLNSQHKVDNVLFLFVNFLWFLLIIIDISYLTVYSVLCKFSYFVNAFYMHDIGWWLVGGGGARSKTWHLTLFISFFCKVESSDQSVLSERSKAWQLKRYSCFQNVCWIGSKNRHLQI